MRFGCSTLDCTNFGTHPSIPDRWPANIQAMLPGAGRVPRLTEQEQQEVIRYLEADRPLPDKYRLLLFEDKREVELVWNGKTSDVCNIVLAFQVIEKVDEPRAEKPEDTTLQDLCLTNADASSKAGPTSSSGATTSSFSLL